MKLFVNEEACIGCGLCVATDSEHFDFNEDNLSEVISQENIDGENTKKAIDGCPTNAISYVTDTESPDETDTCEHCDGKCNHNDSDCGHNCENK